LAEDAPKLAGEDMPRVSQFHSIEIYIYYQDLQPPHCHAIYGENEMLVGIDAVQILSGRLPRAQERLVIDWAQRRQQELVADWQ
jgi:hypothetical protein